MKAFVAFAALCAAGVHASPAVEGVSPSLMHAALRAKWSSFKAQHGKEYAHQHEDAKRMATFLENARAIEKHNARFHQGLESFEMAHNELSDLTLQEIQSTRMGVVMPPNAEEIMANATLHVMSTGYQHPANLDWRTWGGVQQVKNQGSCGSCYSFSAAGAIETAHWRKFNTLIDVSEQHMLDCTGEYGNGGCSGGWMHTAFKYVQEKGGAVAQNQYPYTERVGTCQGPSKPKVTKLSNYVRIGTGNEKQLLDAVATVGSVSIAYNAGTQQHSYYRGGILDIPNCGNRPTHAVLLVGYGTENGQDFWILKNSWGASWGEKGFFRLARGKNMCGIADWASYPIV